MALPNSVRFLAVLAIVSLGGATWWLKGLADAPLPVEPPVVQPDYLLPESAGVVPEDPPEFNVDVDLTHEGDKDILIFTIGERHGWGADAMTIEYWHVRPGEDGEWRQIDDPGEMYLRAILDFGSTLTVRTPIHDREFPELDDYGTSENWRARIIRWGKVLAPNPG